MKFKHFLWGMVGLLLLLSTHAKAQGPIYNFNFFNQTTTTDQNKNDVKAPANAIENLTTPTVKIDQVAEAGPTPRTSFAETDANTYIFGSFLRSGSKGPVDKQANNRDLHKTNRAAWAKEYNESSRMISQQTEFGIAIPKMDVFFLETALVYKHMEYNLVPNSEVVGPIFGDELSSTYSGQAYGAKLGFRVPFNLSKSFNFILGAHGLGLMGTIQYPQAVADNKKPSANYLQVGGDIEAGLDFKVTKNITLGVLAQYGRYDIKVKNKPSEEEIPDMVKTIIQREREQMGAGASLKIFI